MATGDFPVKMDPNFNSSDVESDGEPKLNPRTHRGAASIEKFLAVDPMQRRMSSKKIVKHLSLSEGTPSPLTANDIELLKNRWHAFEREILGRKWVNYSPTLNGVHGAEP